MTWTASEGENISLKHKKTFKEAQKRLKKHKNNLNKILINLLWI